MTIECHYGRSKGVGARGDTGALPDADRQKFKTCTVPMKYNYARVTFTGPTIAATRDAKGAYARVVDTEIRGAVTDLQKEINRQLWGGGYGVLGRWESGASSAQYWAKAYRGNTVASDGFGSTFGGKYVEENGAAVIVIMSSKASSKFTVVAVDGTDVNVSAVDSTTYTSKDGITMTSTGSTEATGAYFIRPGNSPAAWANTDAAGAHRYEMMGIRGVVTNQNLDEISLFDASSNAGFVTNDPFQDLSCTSTYTWWKSNVMTHPSGRYGGQRALSLDLMQQMFDKVEIKAGKDYGPDLIMTTHSLRREYLELMQADRRNVNTMKLDGGFTALEYNGTPLMVDYDAIDGEIYFLTTKDLAIFRMSDYDWMTKDGAVLSRISGYDAYEAVLFRYAELGARRRNSHGVICDLNYTGDR